MVSAVPQQDQIRNYLECNVDYWYERNEKSGFNMGRPIESLLLQLKEDSHMLHSIILTVHNKDYLIKSVIEHLSMASG